MLENGDLVSIVIPAYNTEQYILPMIDSLKKQTYKNLQIIFVDDGSRDDTAKIIKKSIKSLLKFFLNLSHLFLVILYTS